ncbi:NAD(P)-dependent oxidoreductase [Williamsia sp. 1135]|uniref:NAD-dependent epimerase/dehydratase family protein n=1 Tax=Williamsia sp. 1135 TaxID=1889262 RepID=UPI000A0FEC1C|nr:NAD(P)-dependent oxidoreductase [Williamsia sp. 1135]ORM36545.1 epimerase [Williamsia sp. 1135]
MRVAVTGSRGKVGSEIVHALCAHGHDVVGFDITRPVYDSAGAGYVQADVTDAGDMFAAIRDFDAVVHTAGIPEPTKNVAHRVFSANIMGTFNVIEAAIAAGVPRLINISSDSVPGYTWSSGMIRARSYPIDETDPVTPVDPYALSKYFGEQLCDSACLRSPMTAVSIRATWVITPDTYESELGPLIRDPSVTTAVFRSYLDVRDLADLVCMAAETNTPGHEVMFAAAADNIGGHPTKEALEQHHPDVRVKRIDRVDAGGFSLKRPYELFGWEPKRSWRDHLSE